LVTFPNIQHNVHIRTFANRIEAFMQQPGPHYLHWKFTNPFGGLILESALRIVNKKERAPQPIPQEGNSD